MKMTLVFLVIFFTTSASTLSRSDELLIGSVIVSTCLNIYVFNLKYLKQIFIFIFFLVVILLIYLRNNGVVDIYTWLGVFSKIILSYNVVNFCKDKFVILFIRLTYWGTLISFPLYLLQNFFFLKMYQYNNFFGVEGSRVGLDDISSSILFNMVDIHKFRNCGFMWEPGAFAAVLILALSLSFFQRNYIDKEKIILVLGILITFSTMGYVVLFMILFYFVFNKYKSIAIIMFIPTAFIMLNLDFLFNKIVDQWQFAQIDILRVEKSPKYNGAIGLTRFASILIDINIVLNNPILGLGFDINTVGWDKFYGETGGDKVVRASGIMFSLVKTGIFGTTLYFIFLYRSIKRFFYRINHSGLFFCFIVLCILFSNPIDYSTLLFSFLFLPNLRKLHEKKEINL